MRYRNPSTATWISLALGGVVGYGVYRAITGASAATSNKASIITVSKNATPDQIAQIKKWAAATNAQVAAGDAAGDIFASQEKNFRDFNGITAQGPNAVRATNPVVQVGNF